MSSDTLENALKSPSTYVSFEDGTEWVAPLKSYSLLPQYFWELVNHKPVEDLRFF